MVLLYIHIGLLLGGITTCAVLLFRRRWYLAIAILVATPLLMFGWYRLSGTDLVASSLFPNDTTYAPGFTEERFQFLASDADRGAVLAALGRPLSTALHGTREYWYYSHHGPRHENYWNMIIILDHATGRIVEKHREFYVD